MSDSHPNNHDDRDPGSVKPKNDKKLEELRRLILKPEQDELENLKERLDNPRLRAEEVSQILSEAMVQRARRDSSLSQALSPLIEDGIKVSIKKDPRALVSAIFPLIGPAIRKAISETFTKMVQSLNQALEHSFSVKGLKWRLEAMRTGKSFAEVVILHNLVYHVEQVFLIHRETGLLLNHVVAEQVTYQDADVVSGMLTAIQDFVHDSFTSDSKDELRTMQVGELAVWIESSPNLLLAAVIRGTPSEDLRQVFQDTIASIQLQMGNEIEEFQGNSEAFNTVKPYLQDCLQVRLEKKKKKALPIFPIIAGIIVVALIVLLFFSIRTKRRWSDFIDQLNSQQGIIVTEVDKRDGKRLISGLRDPLAIDPVNILEQTELKPENVVFDFEPYQALDKDFVFMRVQKALNPPQNIKIGLQDDLLNVSGAATLDWVRHFQNILPVLDGLGGYSLGLDILDENGQPQLFVFDKGRAQVQEKGNTSLELFSDGLVDVYRSAMQTGQDFRIDIVGHSSMEGSDSINQRISIERAEAFEAILISRGIKSADMNHVGVGSSKPIVKEKQEDDKRFNRSVSFRLYLSSKQRNKEN
ncbi:OmpA family protein [bacterium]|nr:OmpA family protein [bacterium]